jgi:hypothetical protein
LEEEEEEEMIVMQTLISGLAQCGEEGRGAY